MKGHSSTRKDAVCYVQRSDFTFCFNHLVCFRIQLGLKINLTIKQSKFSMQLSLKSQDQIKYATEAGYKESF